MFSITQSTFILPLLFAAFLLPPNNANAQEKVKKSVDYFGLRSISRMQIENALGIESGRFPKLSVTEIRSKLLKLVVCQS